MYEEYTSQALPEKDYRELLGSAICVFNSNNNFMIENILRIQTDDTYNWYTLIDKESGKLKSDVRKIINNEEIYSLFEDIVVMRNRIIHSYQITESQSNEQILCTKTKNPENKQFHITREYLMEFIKKNESLCLLLHKLRIY